MTTFEYRELKASQNAVEEDFLTKLSGSIPKETQVAWIMDRGYGRASLLVFCRKQEWLYIIRGRSHVKAQYQEQGKVKRMSSGRLRHRQGVARRYRNVLYHGVTKEKVDIIVYRERGFKEPWFLLVPPDSEDLLPTEMVVSWYRARMAQKYPALIADQAEGILESEVIYLAPGCRNVSEPWGTEEYCLGADATGAGLVVADAALAATPHPL